MTEKLELMTEEQVVLEDDFDDFDDFDRTLDLADEMTLDDADLASFGEIDTDIPFPHIRIQTKQLQSFLRMAKLLSAASGRDVVSKSVSFHVENHRLVCRATDFDSYVSQSFEILNDTNVLEEEFVIPIDILMKLAKACPSTTAILLDEEGFKMRLAGGDIILETYTVPLDKYLMSDGYDKVAETEAVDLAYVIQALTPIVSSAANPSERRIVFTKDYALASYMWAVAKIPGVFADFDLRIKDLAVLKILLRGVEGTVQVNKTKDEAKVPRTVITGDDFEYATLGSTIEISHVTVNQLESVTGVPGVHIDLVQLFKMVEVSADLPYSIGRIGLNYDSDGVSLAIKTKKGRDSIFSLSGSQEGAIKTLDEEIQVQSKLLRILLRSFQGSASVKVVILKEGLGIESESIQAACFVEG